MSESRLLGPREVYAHFQIATLDDWRQLQRRLSGPGTSPHTIDTPVVAYVNHGRWLADCPACGNGMAASREWNLALCICGCGAIYAAVVFPPDADAIEHELVDLPVVEQNWQPTPPPSEADAEVVA